MKVRIKLENGKEPVTSGKEKQKQEGGSNKENQIGRASCRERV